MSAADSVRSRPRLWHVGGEDVHARIPLLLRIADRFEPTALGSDGAAAFADTPISFLRYHLARRVDPLGDRRTIRELEQLVRAHAPHIVHGFDTKPAIYAMLAAKRSGLPLAAVRTVTGLGYLFSEDSIATRTLRLAWSSLQRRAGRAADWTVFQNDDDRDELIGRNLVKAERTSVIRGSGIDIAHFRTAMADAGRLAKMRAELALDDGPVVLMAARLVSQKGVREYLTAAARIRLEQPKVQFLLVGPSEGEGPQAISASELGRQNAVRWLGRRNDLPMLMQLSDLFVLPSYYREGVPRVLMEAALAGSLIVTTDMPGCRDVVIVDQSGLLVAPRDTDSLEVVMRRGLEMGPERRSAMAAKGRQLVENGFSLDRVASEYVALYEWLLREKGVAVG